MADAEKVKSTASVWVQRHQRRLASALGGSHQNKGFSDGPDIPAGFSLQQTSTGHTWPRNSLLDPLRALDVYVNTSSFEIPPSHMP